MPLAFINLDRLEELWMVKRELQHFLDLGQLLGHAAHVVVANVAYDVSNSTLDRVRGKWILKIDRGKWILKMGF
jgi:hypothetical protein